MKQCMAGGDPGRRAYPQERPRSRALYANGYRYDPERKGQYGHYQHEGGQKMWSKIGAALAGVDIENCRERL
jgi:hypothetical protein